MMIDKQQPRFRHEYKYRISAADDLVLAARLRRLFSHDAHAGPQGVYRVSSLYYDTPEDEALRQKIDGVNEREKFRLRHYNGDIGFIRLEKKLKKGGLCAKYSARLTLSQTECLLSGDLDFLIRSGDPLMAEFYSKLTGRCLQPKAVVCYDREAFYYPPGNVRVTIDRKLRRTVSVGDFLSRQPYYIDMSDGLAVLEVKYDAFLPDVVRLAVRTPNRAAGAYSKYAVCRRLD